MYLLGNSIYVLFHSFRSNINFSERNLIPAKLYVYVVIAILKPIWAFDWSRSRGLCMKNLFM